LSKELTYTIPARGPNEAPQVIKNMQRVRENLVTIPIGRMDLIPDDYEIVDKRIHVPVDFPQFKFPLRESQQAVYDELDDNCIINAWVSWGKTFTGLAIAGKLGQKTLVVTHTTSLRDQWAKEVQKVYGITPGIIGSGKFNIDAPIVIGNTQTLYRNIPKIRKEFGTIILDEMHHVSSPTFSKILDTNYCRYKIGLSGTVERKDGKHVVFKDYFSSKLFKPPRENFMTPTIEILRSEVRFMDGASVPWAKRINALANNDEYRHTVAMLAAAYAAKGHKVLVVSDRVHFLKSCAELTGEKAVCVTGEVAHEEREKLVNEILYGDKNVLYGTQAIFSEGISVNSLSCLILGTPINNEPLLTQLIGRVIRKQEGKRDPVVIDIHLKGKTAQRQASNRMGYYMKQGYQIRQL
jgi:superfamily II DNA or RNA helicase